MLLLAACGTHTTASTPSPTPVAAAVLVLPTIPGATNPAVTQATIRTTICRSGWTATVRPPVSYTGKLKAQLYKAQHASGGLAAWELDHLIPLEVGGAPRAADNLWLQPIGQARIDDRGVEGQTRADVCAGRLSLAEGQARVVDWKHTRG